LANARQEIQNLKELLKAYKTMGPEERSLHRSILAKNLGHSPQLYRRGLVLSPDGAGQVQVGSPVVYQNQLIGLVDEVSKSWCHVQLLADPEFKIAVDIISSKKNEAPAEGWPRGILGGQIAVSNGSEVIVRHIDNSRISDIQVGDYVVTSGFDFKVQKGLLIGKVRDVVEGNLFLHLPVKLQLDPLSKPLYKILPPMPNPFQKASQ
jgi:cell shape-determining protein MreC